MCCGVGNSLNCSETIRDVPEDHMFRRDFKLHKVKKQVVLYTNYHYLRDRQHQSYPEFPHIFYTTMGETYLVQVSI